MERVLVVDDNEELRYAIAAYLRDEGYSVQEAADGAEALQLLERQPLPGAVLLNLIMPRVDGEAVLRRLRADPRLERLPVIVITGLAEPPSYVRTAATDVFIKPFDLGRLAWTLRHVRVSVVDPATSTGASAARRFRDPAVAMLVHLVRALVKAFFRIAWGRSRAEPAKPLRVVGGPRKYAA